MDHTFAVSGMHCGACLGRIKTALQPFAETVEVTISPQRATLRNPKGRVSLPQLQSAIATAGPYTISPLRDYEMQGSGVDAGAEGDSQLSTYWPLIVIVAYIAVASFAGAGVGLEGSFEPVGRTWMLNFMAGFFLVFSAFKFLDLRGFADAYASYDLLAKQWPGYGFIYPFLELALGLAYLFRFELKSALIATVVLMGFSALGVIQALSERRVLQCACLGTALKLPMSTITLVEDVGMAAMAAAMLLA